MEILEAVLSLQQTSTDRYEARHLSPNMNGLVFGGQFVANALSAAMHTVDGRPPHALTAFFLRPGLLGSPLQLSVTRVRDGANFSHRHVDIHQAGKLLLTAEVSFHDGGVGPAHQVDAPAVALPEALEDITELVARYGSLIAPETASRMLMRKSLSVRPADAEAAVLRPTTQPRLAVWLKAGQPMTPSLELAYASAAFCSDYWLPAPMRSMHAANVYATDAPMTTLNHSLWFHGAPPINDYLLYAISSPVTAAARGIGHGLMYDRQGRLFASAMQEAYLHGL
jgi:acyl-CoA thioesterase-2